MLVLQHRICCSNSIYNYSRNVRNSNWIYLFIFILEIRSLMYVKHFMILRQFKAWTEFLTIFKKPLETKQSEIGQQVFQNEESVFLHLNLQQK